MGSGSRAQKYQAHTFDVERDAKRWGRGHAAFVVAHRSLAVIEVSDPVRRDLVSMEHRGCVEHHREEIATHSRYLVHAKARAAWGTSSW